MASSTVPAEVRYHGVMPAGRQSLAMLGAVLLGVPACYETVAVSQQDFRRLGSGLATPQPLATAKGKRMKFDAQTKLRVRTTDGGATEWVSAGDVLISEEGLRFEEGIKGVDLARASVQGLAPDGRKALADLAPPLARVETSSDRREGDEYLLTTARPSQLLPWVSRFVAGQDAAGAEVGRWGFEEKPPPFWAGRPARSFGLPPEELRQPLAGTEPVVLARGVRWPQVASFEVNYLDPVVTASMVPASVALWPLALLASHDNGEASDRNSSFGESPKLLWRASQGAEQPLFVAQARRRAIVKVLASAGGGVIHRGDVFTPAVLGLRFLDFYEAAAVVGELWPHGEGSLGSRVSLVGFTFGLHIDGDGDPRFAFYAGFEGVGVWGRHDVALLSLLLGPRFGLGSLGFVEVIPLGLSGWGIPETSSGLRLLTIVRMGGAF